MFAALLDTCTIVPSLRRDFLLSLAVQGAYRPLWSEQVLEELHYVTIRRAIKYGDPADAAHADADHLLAEIRRNFDDALVTGWEGLVGTYGLPDADDEHVVAAAIVGGAGVIVTENLKDFPEGAVPANLKVQHPVEFAADTVAAHPAEAISALVAMSARRTRTKQSPSELLKILVDRYDMVGVGDMLELYVE